jgi:hypothetical protein
MDNLKQQKEKRKKLLLDLFPPKQSAQTEKIQKILEENTPHQYKKNFENEYDENAYEIIGLSSILTKEQFAKLPDIDATTAYYIIKRMKKAGEYDTDAYIGLFKIRPSASKKQETDKLWWPYQKKFVDNIKQGMDQPLALNEIGKVMEKDKVWNKISKKDPNKILTRPDRTTLYRKLVRDNPLLATCAKL